MHVDKKATMPLRVSLNLLYYTPQPELIVSNLLEIPLRPCGRTTNTVAAIASVSNDGDEDNGNSDVAEDEGRRLINEFD